MPEKSPMVTGGCPGPGTIHRAFGRAVNRHKRSSTTATDAKINRTNVRPRLPIVRFEALLFPITQFGIGQSSFPLAHFAIEEIAVPMTQYAN